MNKPEQIRVALFTDTYDEVNGVANTFRYLTEYCRDTAKQLDIYTHSAEADSVQQLETVRIHRYEPTLPVDIYFDMIFDLKIPRLRVFNDFRSQHYDIVHTATPGSMGLNALAAARLAKTPLVGSYHTTLPEYLRKKVESIVQKFKLPTRQSGRRAEDIMWEYMQWYYDQTRLVLAPSEHIKSLLETKLQAEVGIFSRGVDTDRFQPALRQGHKDPIVLYVGRVSIDKNLYVLAQLFKDRHDAKLVIVGDGPYMGEMKQMCPDTVFRGFLKGRDLSTAYASADVFVFPSTTDTFGNVVLEAMSSGVPPIVTDKMGPKELITDGHNGFIAHDTTDFRAKLDMLLHNEALRIKMGENARKYALTRSWHAVFDKLFADYHHVLQQT